MDSFSITNDDYNDETIASEILNNQPTSSKTIVEEEDEFILQGPCLPLESRRSCELAVECWNLRNSLIEADQSYGKTKKDLRLQRYSLSKLQSVMFSLREAIRIKDRMLVEKDVSMGGMKRRLEEAVASRRSLVNNYARTEHDHKDILFKYSRLELENCTLRSQM